MAFDPIDVPQPLPPVTPSPVVTSSPAPVLDAAESPIAGTASPIAADPIPAPFSTPSLGGTAATSLLFGRAGTAASQIAVPKAQRTRGGIPSPVNVVTYPPGVFPS